eukprot:g4473.t1
MQTLVFQNSPLTLLHTKVSTIHRKTPCLSEKYSRRVRPSSSLQSFSSLITSYGPQLVASHPGWPVGLFVNTAVYITGLRVLLNGLTWAGVAHSWFLGSSIYSAFGFQGYLLVCLYFVIGSRVTKIRLEQKQAEGIAEKRSGRRSIASVWGSGFAGVGCALLALSTGNYSYYQIGFVASFGSKLSDTVSSEIGKAYGRTTFLVTTFKQCRRGTEGAISVEGTIAGVGTALTYSFLAHVLEQVSLPGAGIVFLSCVVSNFVESYIGATVQGRLPWLTNDVVNVIQITLAAALAIALQNHTVM